MLRKLDLIGVQSDWGASQRGASMGPAAIRFGGLVEGLERQGHHVRDRGDILAPRTGASREKLLHYEQVSEVNRRVYLSVTETLEEGRFPVILGGDHSIAAGSIAAVSKRHSGNIGVIWIDANGDWNSEESTCTGNMHGMPFSAVCGYGPDCMVEFGQGAAPVNVAHCVQVGGRDIDDLERQRMAQAGVTVFPINMIDKLGMGAVIEEAVPGTGVIVYNGLTPREAFLAAEAIAESRKLISMDMVEVNPFLDTANKSGILASELIQSALGKSVY
ncbi:MAG: arginase [Flavonifractor plautii]|nr:arginase [Flavonifractor plautii]